MKRKLSSLIAVFMLMLLIGSTAQVYAAEEKALSIEVPVEVILSGPVLDSKDTFTIELDAETSGAPMPVGAKDGSFTDSVEGAGLLKFKMEYSSAGVFSYKIKQLKGDNADCTYDTTEYSLTVYVTVNEDWELEVTTVLEDPDGKKLDTAVFKNVYAPPKPAKLDPPVKKVIKVLHGTPPADAVFTFAMIPSQADAPMPEPGEARKDEATGALYKDIVGEGEYEFGWMYFDENDIGKTYVYALKEIPGDTKGFTYDTTNYTMTVVVSVKNREIILDVKYTNDSDDSEVEKAIFTNVYDEGETPHTGDTTRIFLWVLAGVVEIATVFFIIYYMRRQRKNTSE